MSDRIEPSGGRSRLSLFLCGDVMTGRGIDQIMSRPSRRELRETSVKDARAYVQLAERAHGPIAVPVPPAYIWGDAARELAERAPDARIINLETAITRSAAYDFEKGIHYRMHPENIGCLTAAGVDVCTLVNNHVLDFGRSGLLETLDALAGAGIRAAGAGRNLEEARRPATLPIAGGGRLLVYALGTPDSGVPFSWIATDTGAGIDVVSDLSDAGARRITDRIGREKDVGDVAIVSIHWGTNWGYEVPAEHIRFAHRLVENGADVVHGHSSHHPRPIEVWNRKLILYGRGDFIDDYEGIPGYEAFRDDLVVMYFADLDPRTGDLVGLEMVPLQLRRMRLQRPSLTDARWLANRLGQVSEALGASVVLSAEGTRMRLRHVAPVVGGPVDDARLATMLAPTHAV